MMIYIYALCMETYQQEDAFHWVCCHYVNIIMHSRILVGTVARLYLILPHYVQCT